MAVVSICSDFGMQENKVCHCFHCFPIYLPWSDVTGYHDLHFLNENPMNRNQKVLQITFSALCFRELVVNHFPIYPCGCCFLPVSHSAPLTLVFSVLRCRLAPFSLGSLLALLLVWIFLLWIFIWLAPCHYSSFSLVSPSQAFHDHLSKKIYLFGCVLP